MLNRHSAPPLEGLATSGGCLARSPAPNVPLYRISQEQRRDLEAFLTWYRAHPDVSRAPTYELGARVRQFRCVACHQVDGAGPAATLAESTPSLTGIGAKLRTKWLDRVLTCCARVRRWQELRMPDYDPAHARPLAASFAKAAGAEPGDGVRGPDSQHAEGAGYIGTDPKAKGMGCIGCHDWGSHKSLGEDGPQLISAAERLRYEWYYRWMLNPARILSGDVDAELLQFNGTSQRGRHRQRAVERHEPGRADGAARRLRRDRYEPRPGGASRLPEACPSSSAGICPRRRLPLSPSACLASCPTRFDAGESRLRYAWRGGFIDLSETLVKKTDKNHLTPTATLVGDVFYRSDGFPIRVGEPDRVPQRRFRGYKLVDGFPEFRYDVDGIGVTERILPMADSRGIGRKSTVAGVDRPMWFIDGQTKQRIEIARGKQVRFTVRIPAQEEKQCRRLAPIASLAACLSAQVQPEHYRVENVPTPKGLAPEVGAITFAPDGRLAVAMRRGTIQLFDPATSRWSKFAEGFQSPMGILSGKPGEFFVVHLPESTRIADTNGDGEADVYETIADAWGLSGNYHEFIYGPVRDKNGNLYVSLGCASNGAEPRAPVRGELTKRGRTALEEKAGIVGKVGHYSPVPYRGCVLKIDPRVRWNRSHLHASTERPGDQPRGRHVRYR